MKYLLPLLAVIGVGIAVVVLLVDRPSAEKPPAVRAPHAPFESYVAGSGMLEASSQNIAVGTPVSGIVAKIIVKWGDRVKAGDPLFTLDDRDLQARLVSATARIREAEAALKKASHELERREKLAGTDGVSVKDLQSSRDDVVIDQAALESAQAQAGEVRAEIERRTICAPIAGRVLRINVRLGELALADGTAGPLMLLGDDDTLHVRVEVDEHDAWRIRPGAKATAFLRGNPELAIPLEFVRIEPYVMPKSVLTGSGAERTDVRVLQVIYGFDRASWPVYVGQQMDVFIEAPAAGSGAK